MKNKIMQAIYLAALLFSFTACSKKGTGQTPPVPPVDSGLVNTSHLDLLTVPVNFPDGAAAAGVYIYSQYPDYHPVAADGEGFTCVDDVARAALVYARSSKFATDTAVQSRLFHLIQFVLEMQSSNGYFYNFLFPPSLINTGGATSVNAPNWWSWRALQALTETAPAISGLNPGLFAKMNVAINKLVAQMKTDLVYLPQTTTVVSGVTIPQWLPAGSGTDQSATLILGLIPYCTASNDTAMKSYIKKLADGILLMQQGDSTHFPYNAFLSWQNTWHAYGNGQGYALMRAGVFLDNPLYTAAAMAEVDHFYPWLLTNGFKASFTISENAGVIQTLTQNNYDQIAYGIEPMVFAAAEAYRQTNDAKYADLAGHIAAWLLGANEASANMYIVATGVCFDGLSAGGSINFNSGGESTIEALLIMEKIESAPQLKAAINKYKKP